MAERMQSNKFDFNDMLQQMRMMKKLSGGGMGGLLGMLPGMSKMKDAVGPDADKKLKHTEALILSMTPKERSRPEIINGQRRKRICNGAGPPVMEMNQLLKQYEMMKKLMKNQGAMMQMANAMMGGAGGPGGGMGGMGGLGSLLGGLGGGGGGGKMPKMPQMRPGSKFRR
jgi:signal recognition particle subunit SRP54